MAISAAQRKAVAKYNAANYDRVEIRIPKGRKAEIEAHAKEHGKSVSAYISDLVQADMGYSQSTWKKSSTETAEE